MEKNNLPDEALENVSGGIDIAAGISDISEDNAPPKGSYCHYCGTKLTKIGVINAKYRCMNCGAKY